MHKSYRYILILIIILGFALRLKISHELLLADPNVLNPSSLTDMAVFKELASQIAQGTYWQPFYFQPFYYAVFLPGIFRTLGTNISYVLLIQSLLGSLIILFAALSAEMLWNKKTAIITALLLLFSQTLSFYTPFLLIATLQSFWLSLLLYMTLLGFKNKKNVYWIYIGFITGCSILTRGNMWLFVPVLFALAIYYGIKQGDTRKNFTNKHIMPIILFLLFMILPQIPFIYINTKILHTLSCSNTVAGVALAYGNTPESPPSANDPEFGAGITTPNPTQQYWLDTAQHKSIIQRIINFIREKPLSYIELTFRKLLLFWDYREIPNNVDINTERFLSPTLNNFCFITTSIFMLFAIPGILIYLPFISREKRKYLIPFLFVLTYWISISLVKILAKYRVPLTPLMAVYASGFINFIVFKKSNIKKILVVILLVVFSTFVVFFSYDFYRYNLESKVIKLINPNGVSVNMKDKTMYLDNGPAILGSWNFIKLKQNNTLTKKFITNDNSISPVGTFNIAFVADTPIEATIEINGKSFHLKTDKPGIITRDFNIPIENNDSSNTKNKNSTAIKITVKQLTGKLYSIIDLQRCYGRTSINNKPINAELVCRLFLKHVSLSG